jgi:hypothetical protein
VWTKFNLPSGSSHDLPLGGLARRITLPIVRSSISCCVNEIQPLVAFTATPRPTGIPSLLNLTNNHLSYHQTRRNRKPSSCLGRRTKCCKYALRDSRRVLRSLISADSKQNRSEANVRSFEDALTYEAVIPTLYGNMDIQADKSSSLTSTCSASLLHSSGGGALAHSEFDSG